MFGGAVDIGLLCEVVLPINGYLVLMLVALENKIRSAVAIDIDEARWLFEKADDATLKRLATEVKCRFHRADRATYLVMAIINYTNVCVANCDFCSFFRFPHQDGGYLLSSEQVLAKISEFKDYGATLIAFNGGFNPKLKIADYAKLFDRVHSVYGDQLTFFEMTVAEFMFACKISRLSYHQGAKILRDVGTQWITGGGAEILTDSFRQRHSQGKYRVEDYYDAQQAIISNGIASTATMVIGFDETLAERLEHLQRLRRFQSDNADSLVSFLCWTYKPYNNRLGGQEISVDQYWRWLAVCRIFLDNFVHIRTSVLTKNAEALQGLDFGANDFDIPLEDEVTIKAGATISEDYRPLLAYAKKLGHNPCLRQPF